GGTSSGGTNTGGTSTGGTSTGGTSTGGSAGSGGAAGGSGGGKTDGGGFGLPADPGPFAAAIPPWVFGAQTGKCETFIYGGCGGNANNFKTADECVKACAPSVTPCDAIVCDTGLVCVFVPNQTTPSCLQLCPDGGVCPSGAKCGCGASCP